MTTTAHDDQYTTDPEPLRQPYDTVAILRRNVADLEIALRKQTERAESYAETLRSIASYVGAGGYNAETVDAGVFEEKIRWGIGEIMKRAEAAEAGLAKLREQKPVAWCDADGDFYSGESYPNVWPSAVPLYASPVPAPAVPEEWRKFVGFLAQQTTFPHPAVCICQACTWIKKARALLQSPAVKDSLTSQADCRACVNRGRVNGLSQETYCESCVYEGRNWRKNHFLDAAGQRLLESGE